MRHLGKICILFILFLTALFAKFEVSVSDNNIALGDQIIVTFSSTKSDKFPLITDIGGFEIQSRSQERQTRIINGKVEGSFKMHYVITPTHTFTIPSYTMIEAGKTVHSDPITVTVTKNATPMNGDIVFSMKASKKELYVGEPFFVTITYKQAKSLDIVDRQLVPPEGKHFWIEKKPIEKRRTTPVAEVITLSYLFTPQKEGNLTIHAAQIKIGERSLVRDAWGMLRSMPKYRTFFTDPIAIKVKPLPQAVDAVGNFSFKVTVDKRASNEREAVNVTIAIEGAGNVMDIEPFKLDIDGVMVYDEKPKRNFEFKEGKYYGSFSQKFALVSSKSYTIPALTFSYFDTKLGRSVVRTSEPIPITITPSNGAKQEQKPSLKVEKLSSKHSLSTTPDSQRAPFWLWLVIFFVGVLVGWLLSKLKLKASKSRHKELKNSDPKAIILALMPYREDEEAKAMIELLSENLYENAKHPIDKKSLKALFNRLGIE